MKLRSYIPATLLLLLAGNTNAQNVYSYQFNNNLNAGNGAPALVAVCPPTYAQHTFTFSKKKAVHTVCHFNAKCGFVFTDKANFLQAGSYTIEMYVELDTTSGYRKFIDYQNLTQDDGVYNNDGACTFRGPGSVSGTYFSAGAYSLVTITRDGNTKALKMYANGQYVDGFNDTENPIAIYDASKTLHFLQDDTYSAGSESTPGNIAFLNIYNYPMTDAMVKSRHASLDTILAAKPAIH